MGTIYRTSFTPYLELFEPRSVYISELRLQHAWKNSLWKQTRYDTKGRKLRILSPGRHNHSDGPDFLDARIMLDEKLLSGDIELHHRPSDWYAHDHHIDHAYDHCILHIVFHEPRSSADARCAARNVLPTCYISLEEVLDMKPPGSCRIFSPNKENYFDLLYKQGWTRVNKKVRYFYDNRLRFPSDVMLYWGLFKACGYRYNEENMIKLFVRFPWAAYCDGLLDRQDIIPILNELGGFSAKKSNEIRWTRSRTRPVHFPENRVDWLGRLMTLYYRASLSGILYETCRQKGNINEIKFILYNSTTISPPGTFLQKEILLNTILPLMEAMRKENGDKEPLYSLIRDKIENSQTPIVYGVVKRFHDQHDIEEKDKRQRNWLISQGVLNIHDQYCSQGMQINCPICLMDEAKKVASK
ncbi:MAG: DUF2851 family protein [Candidatus Marinimicrobia bacterium]|nr:DUF2851 family protein [Candidatus Neomarinimicrobiota bacterium]